MNNVKQPKHYTSHPSGIECKEITSHMCFNLGNAFKYIWRCDLKSNAIEDLEKAVQYLDFQIELIKSREEPNSTFETHTDHTSGVNIGFIADFFNDNLRVAVISILNSDMNPKTYSGLSHAKIFINQEIECRKEGL